jgi:hypothetical protein
METAIKIERSENVSLQQRVNKLDLLFDELSERWNTLYLSSTENKEKIKQLEAFIQETIKVYLFDKQDLSTEEELKICNFIENLNVQKEDLLGLDNMVFTNDPQFINQDSKNTDAWRLHKNFQSSHAIKAK